MVSSVYYTDLNYIRRHKNENLLSVSKLYSLLIINLFLIVQKYNPADVLVGRYWNFWKYNITTYLKKYTSEGVNASELSSKLDVSKSALKSRV